MDEELTPVRWVASARKDLKAFPEEARKQVGVALFRAPQGKKHERTKPLQGFGGAGVLEVVASDDGDAFRAVYTVRFTEAVYVLHCFQKKSKSGIATPKTEIELINSRLRLAEQEHGKWLRERNKKL